MPTTTAMSASARQWGALWGDRPRAWAISEEQQTATYAETLRRVRIKHGEHVLDIGCATGVFLRMCVDRGATVFGLDAAEGLLALARERVPEADLRLGDLASLPYQDDSFDVECVFDATWAYVYASDDALADAMLAAGGAGAVAGPEREPDLRAAILAALADCRQIDGSYRIANEWHTVIARAGGGGDGRRER